MAVRLRPGLAIVAVLLALPVELLTSADPAGGSGVQTLDADALLDRATAYVNRFEQTLSAVIWRERYVQEDRVRARVGDSGTRFAKLVGRRRLDSEMLLLWLPQEATWIAVRDVIAVDGAPRPLAERQASRALNSAAVSVDLLRQLARDNARFNIGHIIRTFSEPTLALSFLDATYRPRFEFSRLQSLRLDRRRVTKYAFIERSRPTVIRDGTEDILSRGSCLVDEATGEVLETSLDIANAPGRLQGRITVRFAPHREFDVLVPVEMREIHTSTSGEEIMGIANYTDFRQFETAGRIIVPK